MRISDLRSRIALALGLTLAGCGGASIDQDLADQGEKAAHVCMACHTLRQGRTLIGPSLAGVYGRKAGSEPGFSYSDALSRSQLTWDQATLERFILDPESVVAGTNMIAAGVSPSDARAIVEYLKTQ